MVFSDIPFLFYFFPLFLGTYFLSPQKFRNIILLIFSLVFYAWGEPIYITLLLISSVVDYVNGRALEHFEGQRAKQRVFLCISIIVNLSLMGIFKYAGLFIDTLNTVFSLNITNPEIELPLGISFFTFQTMSYSIDVYRNDVKAEHNFIDYMTYVCMFPQLVAGPIVRYQDISKELSDRKVTFDDFSNGMTRFLFGLFKKVLIANQIGSLWDYVYATESRSAALAWLGLIAFSLQIYFDFSGYSDMAIGMGKMIGFNYLENFNYPYICQSISDFWRRWHMSLSVWFRDYVYISLGGNRKGKARQILNLMIVWALTGFWHGASWNFLLWGVYFGVILSIEKLTKLPEKLPIILRHIYSIFLVLIGWMIFAIEDMSKLKAYAMQLFGSQGIASSEFLYQINNYLSIILIGILLSVPIYPYIKQKAQKNTLVCSATGAVGCIVAAVLVVVCISMLVADSYNPFLYFRF